MVGKEFKDLFESVDNHAIADAIKDSFPCLLFRFYIGLISALHFLALNATSCADVPLRTILKLSIISDILKILV